MSITKFNKNKKPLFTFNATEGFKFFKMEDLYKANGPDAVYPIRGWFYHTGRYGEQPVFITDYCFINGPEHLTEQCKEIEQDPEAVAQINAGNAGFKIRDYINRYNKTSYSIEWVDVADDKLPF